MSKSSSINNGVKNNTNKTNTIFNVQKENLKENIKKVSHMQFNNHNLNRRNKELAMKPPTLMKIHS
jgi:hypothetical protein